MTLSRVVCSWVVLVAVGSAGWAQQIAPPGSPANAPAAAEPHTVAVGSQLEDARTVNALAGYVNAEPIFVQDILRPLDDQLQKMAAQARNLNEFRRNAQAAIHVQLQNYLFDLMASSKAKASLTEQDKAQIEVILRMQLHDLLAKHGGSRALADQDLRARGSSVDREIADVRRKLIKELYYRKELWPKIVVTRQMVMDAYQRDPKKWQKDAELELFTISIPVARWLREPSTDGTRGAYLKNPTPAQVQQAEQQAMAAARDIVQRVKKGEDFATLAEDNSADPRKNAGGRYPHVKRGSMANQKVEDYVFTLPANTVGEPQLVHDADPLQEVVMVVKVGEKTEAHQVTFNEAQAEITKQLQDQQLAELQNQFLLKLEQSSPVENLARMEDTVVDAAVTRYAMGQ
jgi:hypothetical protein